MIQFNKLMGETPKAYLIKIHNNEFWIPKSCCRNFVLNKKLGGNVSLPAFILNKMLVADINESEIEDLPFSITPTWVIEHHTPAKLNTEDINHDKTLMR